MGSEVKVEEVEGKVFVNQAQVVIADVMVANGVMHVINGSVSPSLPLFPFSCLPFAY